MPKKKSIWQAARAASPVSAPTTTSRITQPWVVMKDWRSACCEAPVMTGDDDVCTNCGRPCSYVACVSVEQKPKCRNCERDADILLCDYCSDKIMQEYVLAPVSAEQPTKIASGRESAESELNQAGAASNQATEHKTAESRNGREANNTPETRGAVITTPSLRNEPLAAPSVASEDSATQPTITWQKDLRNEATNTPILNAANPVPQVVVASNEVSYGVKLLVEQDAVRPDGSAKGRRSPSQASTVEPPETGLKSGSEDWMRKAAMEVWLMRKRDLTLKKISAIIAKHYAASQLSTEKSLDDIVDCANCGGRHTKAQLPYCQVPGTHKGLRQAPEGK